MKKSVLSICAISLSLMAAAQQWQTDTFTHQNQLRTYKIYQNSADTTPKKVLLMLHGLGGSMNDVDLTNWNKIADSTNLLLISPQAVDFSVSLVGNIGAAWNSGIVLKGTPLGDIALNPTIDDVSFINTLLNRVIGTENIDTSKLFVAGFSNGGFMTQRLLCESPERFAKAISYSGTKALELNNCSTLPIPVAHFHGTNDPTVNWEGVFDAGIFSSPAGTSVDSLINYWNARNSTSFVDSFTIGAPDQSHYMKHYVYKNASGNEVSLYKILNGSHEWYSYETTNNTFDLAAEGWNFLNGYTPNYHQTSINSVAINDAIQVYPNPATQFLRIKSTLNIHHIAIYTLQGKKVYENVYNNEININDLSAQAYILQITTADGARGYKTFIKE